MKKCIPLLSFRPPRRRLLHRAMSPPTTSAANTALPPALAPFLRAWALGFSADVIPPTLKLLLTHFLRSSPLARRERWRVLVRKLGEVLVSATGSKGVAFASALAIGGGKLLEGFIEPVVRSAYTFVLEKRENEQGKERKDHSKRIRAIATFAATTLSSLLAISLLQSSATYQRPRIAPLEIETDSDEIQLPYPYSSLTSSSSTPSSSSFLATGDESTTTKPTTTKRARNFPVQQSPTLDLTLFLLVRALDSVVRGIYEVSGVTSGRFGSVASFLAAQADTIVFSLSCWRIMVRHSSPPLS